MRTKKTLAAIAFSAALAVGACEELQDEAGEMTETVAIDRPDGEIEEFRGARTTLEARDGSGVSGEVRTRRLDGTVKIEVTLEHTDPSARYVGHVHRGRCGDGGPSVASLGLFDHTPGGATRIETSIDASKLEPEAGYFVQIHGSEHAVIACGPLSEVAARDARPRGSGSESAY